MMNISIAEPLKAFVDAQIEGGAYGSPSELVSDLIIAERDRIYSRLDEHLTRNMATPLLRFSDEDMEGDFVEVCRRKLQEAM